MLKHIFIVTGIIVVTTLCMLYPFLPGPYDAMALPLSVFVQAFGIFGLLLSIIGLLWLVLPKKEYFFTSLALYVGSAIMLIIACIAFFSSGKIFCAIILVVWLLVFFRLRKSLRVSKISGQNIRAYVPPYLIIIPVFVLIAQLLLAKPITNWSRNKAIDNAAAYINDIAAFKTNHGYYPKGIQALHEDYLPQISSIENYHYLPYSDSYNLSFEQPRFLLDVIGTREVVVYNPANDHRAYSHASWFVLLSSEALESTQGWYASETLEQEHWKYFLFD